MNVLLRVLVVKHAFNEVEIIESFTKRRIKIHNELLEITRLECQLFWIKHFGSLGIVTGADLVELFSELNANNINALCQTNYFYITIYTK